MKVTKTGRKEDEKRAMIGVFEELAIRVGKRHNMPEEEVVQRLLSEEEEGSVPLSIFVKELGPLEAVVKFMKENKEYSNKKISSVLKRSEKTIWQAYNFSKSKSRARLAASASKYDVPVDALSDTKKSIMEVVVGYLKDEKELRFNEIASLIGRDQRTVWTMYSRAKEKEKSL